MFDLGDAFVTVNEAQSDAPAGFSLDEQSALRELEMPEGAIRPVNRFSNPDELDGLVVSALEGSIIGAHRRGAYLRIVPSAAVAPGPFLIVEPGAGAPALAAGDLHVTDIEDPMDFTMNFLRLVAERADRASVRFLQANEFLQARAAVARRTEVHDRHSSPDGLRFKVLALPIGSDARTGRVVASARALSLAGALAEVAEKLEEQHLKPDITALNLMVDWVEG
jgi:hypothetical protein